MMLFSLLFEMVDYLDGESSHTNWFTLVLTALKKETVLYSNQNNNIIIMYIPTYPEYEMLQYGIPVNNTLIFA